MKVKDVDSDADARLEEAAQLLEELAAELRRKKKKVAAAKVPADKHTSGEPEGLQKGQRVRVVRKDQYHGRVGVLVQRHGRLFWDVRLDATATRVACVIYKKDASLCAEALRS